MAATMNLRHKATVLLRRKGCAGVRQTDPRKRLPEISPAEIDGIFETANLDAELRIQAA